MKFRDFCHNRISAAVIIFICHINILCADIKAIRTGHQHLLVLYFLRLCDIHRADDQIVLTCRLLRKIELIISNLIPVYTRNNRTLFIGICNIWHIRSKEIYKITIFSGILIISVLSQHSDLLWLRAICDVPYRQYCLVSGRGSIELIVLLKCRTNTLFHNDQSIAIQIHFPDLSV